jgi:DNA-binding NarL/FixJ family response regulator
MREDGVEQATLVRRTVEDQGVPQAREHRENVVPLQSRPREAAVGPYAPVELSHEEIELLAEIATGVTTEVAARHLELSARTLRRRIRNICDVLGVNTPIEAVVWAARRQLI